MIKFKNIMKGCGLKLAALFFIILFSTSSGHAAQNFIELQIPCEINSQVKAILPNNEVVELGQVLSLPIKTNWPAYTASKWCDDATVCASAV
ncbi:MAG: hypothetical protein IJQ29_03120, partial [Synergistaceae bacterium]|nr:hypothetical protein [Synergistaceae bacterium]